MMVAKDEGYWAMSDHRGIAKYKRAWWCFLLTLTCSAYALALQAAEKQGLSEFKANLPESVFAMVGEQTISREEFDVNLHASVRQRFFHGEVSEQIKAQIRHEVAQQMLDQVLLHQEAQRHGLKPDMDWINARVKEVEQQYQDRPQWQQRRTELINSLKAQLERDSLVKQLEATMKSTKEPEEQAIKQYYRQHADKFTTPERIRVSLILLAVEPWAPAAKWQAANDEAIRLLKRLRNGADFAELARLHSSDSSADTGGDLGFVHQGMLSKEAQGVLDDLSPSEMSEPLQLLKGIAIFRLDEREKPVLNNFEHVQSRARGLLVREQQELAWKAMVEELRQTTAIKVNESIY